MASSQPLAAHSRFSHGLLADLLLRSAVERQLFILGEALTQLRHRDEEAAEQIPGCRTIIGFRNLLAHVYQAVDDRRVWDIVSNSLRQTLLAVEELLIEADAGEARSS